MWHISLFLWVIGFCYFFVVLGTFLFLFLLQVIILCWQIQVAIIFYFVFEWFTIFCHVQVATNRVYSECTYVRQQNCCVRQGCGSCTKFVYANIIYFYIPSFTFTLLPSLVEYYFVFLFISIFPPESLDNV